MCRLRGWTSHLQEGGRRHCLLGALKTGWECLQRLKTAFRLHKGTWSNVSRKHPGAKV